MSAILNVTYESPSNIAIVKYWGKKAGQTPINPSMSFTLSKSKTITNVQALEADAFSIELNFEGKNNLKFQDKIVKKLSTYFNELPWLKNTKLIINSENTFPHSTGIASSASSMSALAMALIDIDFQKQNKKINTAEFYQQVSSLARYLSGSAARSIFPVGAAWGYSEILTNSSDQYAIDLSSIVHDKFKKLNDAILIVDANEKAVSSTVGHELMNNHPHKNSRIQHANKNFADLINVLQQGDFEEFARISELEALDLHAMMMTSNPSFILLKPESLKIIDEIRRLKKERNLEITFTIDAGPNIHVLYTEKDKADVEAFLENNFLKTHTVSQIIYDHVGIGAKKIL